MTDTFRYALRRRFADNAPPTTVATIAPNAARETAAKIAYALSRSGQTSPVRPYVPVAPSQYAGGGSGVVANDILGQRGPVVVGPQYQQPAVVSDPNAYGGSTPGAVPVDPLVAQRAMQIGQDRPMLPGPGMMPGPTRGAPVDLLPGSILTGAPGENRTGGTAQDYYQFQRGRTEAIPTGEMPLASPEELAARGPTIMEDPWGSAGQVYHGTLGALGEGAKTVVETGIGKPFQAANEHVPYAHYALDALNKAYEWNTGRIGSDLIDIAQGKQDPSEWPAWNLDNHAALWAADPNNSTRLQLVATQGLDLNGDGTSDVTGGDAVYMMYITEEHPNFIDTMITQMGADPLFAASAVIPIAGAAGKGAAVGRETAAIAGLSRQELIFRAIEAAGAGIERAGGLGLKAADLPFTVPIEIARQMVRGAGRVAPEFLQRAGRWAVGPSDRTAGERIVNQAADVADVVQAAQDVTTGYPPTPGVAEAPMTPYGGRAYPEGQQPVDPATGAPLGTPLTDQPVVPTPTGPLVGGGVGVQEGPVRVVKTPYGRAAAEPLERPTNGLGPAGVTDYATQVEQLTTDPYLDASEAAAASRREAGTAVPSDIPPAEVITEPIPEPAPVRLTPKNPDAVVRNVGDNGDVRIVRRNPVDGEPVYEVQVKTNATGGWQPKNRTVLDTFQGEDANARATARATEHVRTPETPPAEAAAPTTTAEPVTQPPLTPTPTTAAVPVVERRSLRRVEGGMLASAETQYPEQFRAAQPKLDQLAADYENAAYTGGTGPVADTTLRPGERSTEGRADRAVYGAEFYADVKDALAEQGIPVDDLPNVPPRPAGTEIERDVRAAIYEQDPAVASKARSRLYKRGYMSKDPMRATLHDEIMTASLPTSDRYPNGYINIGDNIYTNDGLSAVKNLDVRRELADQAVAERIAGYERFMRINDAQQRHATGFNRVPVDPVTAAAKADILATADEAIARGEGLVNLRDTDEPKVVRRYVEPATSLEEAIGGLETYKTANPFDQAHVSRVERLKAWIREKWAEHQRMYAIHPAAQKFMGKMGPVVEPTETLADLARKHGTMTDEIDRQVARGELSAADAEYLKSSVHDFQLWKGGKWVDATPTEFADYAAKKEIPVPETGNFEVKAANAKKPTARRRELTQMDLLEKTRTLNPDATPEQISQLYANRVNELIGPTPKPYEPMRRPLETARRATRNVAATGKSIALNNPFNVAKGTISDRISDSLRMFWEGHGAAALEAFNPFAYDRELRHQPREIDARAARLGMDIPNEIKVKKGRTEIDTDRARTATNQAVSNLIGLKEGGFVDRATGKVTGLVDTKLGADVRATGDSVSRQAVFLNEIDKRLIPAGQQFRQEARRFGIQNGIAPSSVDAYLYELGDEFSASQVRTQMTELATDAGIPLEQAVAFGDHLGQSWQSEVNTMRAAADAEQKRVLFSYERTNLDETLGKFIFFHYWMTRAVPAYARIALRNPEVAALWMRAWGEMGRRAKEQNQPDSLQGYLRVMGSEDGWYGSMNPWNLLLPVMDLRPEAESNGTWDTITQFVLVNPILQAAASVIGIDNTVVDPLMLYAPRNMAMAIVNKVRASRGQGPYLDDPYENLLRDTYGFANDIASGVNIPFSQKQAYQDPKSFNQVTIRYLVIDQIEQESGLPREEWTQDQWDQYRTAVLDGESGHRNPLYDAAFQDWADETFKARALGSVIPGGYRIRYGPKDELIGVGYTDLSEEQQYAKAMTTAGSPEAMALTEQIQGLDTLGTENGRQGYKLWNEIAYADGIDPNDAVVIDGQTFRGWQLQGMTQGQRERLADRYLAQYGEEIPGQVEEFKGLRTDYLKANPEAGSYKEYQKGVGGYEGGKHAWRLMFARKPESKLFAEAMAKKEDQLRKDGKTGDVLSAELDQWAMSQDAYNAANNFRESIYDQPTTPNVPDYGFATEATGGGAKTGGVKKDPMTQLADHLKGYREKMDTAMAAMQAAGYQVTEADVMNASPLYGAAFSNYGVPQMDRDIALFLQWQALPGNEGLSVDDYITYLENLNQAAA